MSKVRMWQVEKHDTDLERFYTKDLDDSLSIVTAAKWALERNGGNIRQHGALKKSLREVLSLGGAHNIDAFLLVRHVATCLKWGMDRDQILGAFRKARADRLNPHCFHALAHPAFDPYRPAK